MRKFFFIMALVFLTWNMPVRGVVDISRSSHLHFAQQSQSQDAPVKKRKMKKSLAATIAIGYIVVSSLALIFSIGFAFRMRHKQKNKMWDYAVLLTQKKINIHDDHAPEPPVEEIQTVEQKIPEEIAEIKTLPQIFLTTEEENVVEKLKILKELKIKNLISESDYLEKKKEILAHLSEE